MNNWHQNDLHYNMYQANFFLSWQYHLELGEVLQGGDQGKHVIDAQACKD